MFVHDDTMEVETIGETGNGRLQFKVPTFWRDLLLCSCFNKLLQGPSCLVADSKGSVLVVDSHNHRIQLLNPDYTFGAMVKVQGDSFGWPCDFPSSKKKKKKGQIFRWTTLWLDPLASSWTMAIGNFG